MVWRGERYHVVILGSNRVGKTAFLHQLAHRAFKEEVDVHLSKMEETVSLQIAVDGQTLTLDSKIFSVNPYSVVA